MEVRNKDAGLTILLHAFDFYSEGLTERVTNQDVQNQKYSQELPV